MQEITPEGTAVFMERWDAFHDAALHRVEFDLSAREVVLSLQADDKSAERASRDVSLMLEDVTEFAFRQPLDYLVGIVFEAGVMWDGETVLLALDAPADRNLDAFRASDMYFGGKRLLFGLAAPS